MKGRPGERAQISGVYAVRGPRGGHTKRSVTITRGDPFPPTARAGEIYELVERVNPSFTSAASAVVIKRVSGAYANALRELAKK